MLSACIEAVVRFRRLQGFESRLKWALDCIDLGCAGRNSTLHIGSRCDRLQTRHRRHTVCKPHTNFAPRLP
jgi:hypothetical protein